MEELVKLKKLETRLMVKKPYKEVMDNRDVMLSEMSSDDDNDSQPIAVVDKKNSCFWYCWSTGNRKNFRGNPEI